MTTTVDSARIGKVRKAWDDFEGSLRKSLAKAIALGKELIALKESVPHGEFGRFFADHDDRAEGALPFTSSWAGRLMKIAGNDALTNPAHVQDLPADLLTVYELSTMTAPALEAAIEAGKVTPQTTRAEAKEIKREAEGERTERPTEERVERAKRIKSERDVLEDCAQAIEEAIGTALLAYPSLRAAIAARLRLIEQGIRNGN